MVNYLEASGATAVGVVLYRVHELHCWSSHGEILALQECDEFIVRRREGRISPFGPRPKAWRGPDRSWIETGPAHFVGPTVSVRSVFGLPYLPLIDLLWRILYGLQANHTSMSLIYGH